jgi:hypothetical protein
MDYSQVISRHAITELQIPGTSSEIQNWYTPNTGRRVNEEMVHSIFTAGSKNTNLSLELCL